jgi:hypothetical protein
MTLGYPPCWATTASLWLRTFWQPPAPNAVHELTALVGQWTEFEKRISSEIKLWYSTIRQ